MNESDLLTSLRNQVINDELGVVVCRPKSKATDYFELAIGVVKPPPREQRLLTHLVQVVGGEAAHRPYETWSCLFDGLADIMERRPLAARVQSLSLEKCVRAATRTDAEGLQGAMAELFGAAEVWDSAPPPVDACLKKIIQPMVANLEFQPGSQLDLDGLTSSLQQVHGLLAKQANGASSACLDLASSLLQNESGAGPSIPSLLTGAFSNTADPRWLKCRMAALLLEQADQPEQCATHVSILFRDAVRAQNSDIPQLVETLKQAAHFFKRLNAPDAYRDLYLFALHGVSIATTDAPIAADLDQQLLQVHPATETVATLVEVAWDRGQVGVRPPPTASGDVPEWRELFFFLLREPDEAIRAKRMRRWLYQRLTFLFSHEPDRVLGFVDQVVKPLQAASGAPPSDALAWLAQSSAT